MGGELLQTVGEEEDAVDEEAVGRALDLEVAEEGVGAEEGEGFVDGVIGGRVWVSCFDKIACRDASMRSSIVVGRAEELLIHPDHEMSSVTSRFSRWDSHWRL